MQDFILLILSHVSGNVLVDQASSIQPCIHTATYIAIIIFGNSPTR
jgi:hypothetical protein